MTFNWVRYDIDIMDQQYAIGDGPYVLAEDAINREAVNADRIRLLEVQLREAKAALASNKAAALAPMKLTDEQKSALEWLDRLCVPGMYVDRLGPLPALFRDLIAAHSAAAQPSASTDE